MGLPADYEVRVYAGVLGKMIGVYMGKPIEGWENERIEREVGEVDTYPHDRLGYPLIATDDDISGTLTFLRAIEDNGYPREVTPQQIGWTWLNYLIEERTVLWWGGMGNSTEHTAYLRLKAGMRAPASGSLATNGPFVAEQIGAQIFIDAWAMVCPGDPAKAADLARRAASVSHDGEGIYGAQVVAAMEALAFVEPDLGRLLDTAYDLIPSGSIVAALIRDLRAWRAREPDWRKTLRRIQQEYGYGRFPYGHIVPNHALILLALLYGDDDFRKSLMIANTAGWDTDCNSGNVGCLMGIKNGLAGIDRARDLRDPVADRLYLPTADGGRGISDAVTEAYAIVNAGRALAGVPPRVPKGGARYHFSLPGAVQGFQAEGGDSVAPLVVSNPDGSGLRLHFTGLTPDRPARALATVFIPPDLGDMHGYELQASPIVYPGQTISVRLRSETTAAVGIAARVLLRVYGPEDTPEEHRSPVYPLSSDVWTEIDWTVPDLGGHPVYQIGVELAGSAPVGAAVIDRMGWAGAARTELTRYRGKGAMGKRAWLDATDQLHWWPGESRAGFAICQNHGRGLVMIGTREWVDYAVEATLKPHIGGWVGLAARVQGLRRYVALLLDPDGTARLVKVRDGDEVVLGEAPGAAPYYEPLRFRLAVQGQSVIASVGRAALRCDIGDDLLSSGAIAVCCEDGRVDCLGVHIAPADDDH